MKADESKEVLLEKKNAVLESKDASERLGRFFDLLLHIDKRQNLEFYENQKSRNCPDQTP
ncbi:MAG TPA: hypothetical protein VGJ00_00825 [Rhabdochlamydiaceae bacterium]|jgi:hypothetical protein